MIKGPAESCPFKVGDWAVYRPSARGWGLEAMAAEKLIPGQAYKIIGIQRAHYLIVEGYDHPGGGLMWTEFDAIV